MSTFAALSADVAAVGGLDYTSEQTAADRWTNGGLRMISRAAPWEWLHAYTSFNLTANDYDYPFSTIASTLFRIDIRSVRYGDATQYLKWGNIQAIDEALGPDWRDSSANAGTPQYVTRVGNELWVADMPSAAFIADNPTVYFAYWRHEVSTGTLYLPDEFYEIAVDASLAYGFTQEDDPRGDPMMTRWRLIHLPEMRGTRLDIGARDQMANPRHFADGSRLDDYGDGWLRSSN